MTAAAPFDLNLPSPLARLIQLRSGSSEAVVRDGQLSDVQALMARPGAFEDALWDKLSAIRLLVLTGSAGGGKSALLNHLLEREQQTGAGFIGEHLADATHSDAPDRSQTERLAGFFAPFADGTPEPQEPCRVIAMNTGMALRFFTELPGLPAAPSLTHLQAFLRTRLGLRPLPEAADPPSWMDRAVLVVNLDHRTTSGTENSMFQAILQRLDPADPAGVLEGTPRCSTCTVRDWCWPMANVSAISAPPARRALDTAAGDVALARGRQIAPRTLWDAAAELALGGLDTSNLQGRDPCFAIADAAANGDEAKLLHAIACNGALGPVLQESAALRPALPGSLVAEIASRDPGYEATLPTHKIIADGGVDPHTDAEQLLGALGGEEAHPAVERAARALRDGKTASEKGERLWGRILARAAWLSGALQGSSRVDSDYTAALAAQTALTLAASGAQDSSGEDQNLDDIEQALSLVEEGLAAIFGLVIGAEHYYPTSTSSAAAATSLLVRVSLVEGNYLAHQPDPVLERNPAGAALVSYQPLTLFLKLAERPIAVDFPLWQLLRGAANGSTPSSVDLERFLAVRQAIRLVGVRAGGEHNRPLLVHQRQPASRKFRIAVRNLDAGLLRVTEER